MESVGTILTIADPGLRFSCFWTGVVPRELPSKKTVAGGNELTWRPAFLPVGSWGSLRVHPAKRSEARPTAARRLSMVGSVAKLSLVYK